MIDTKIGKFVSDTLGLLMIVCVAVITTSVTIWLALQVLIAFEVYIS